jgi:hypothetical protein
LVLTGLQERLLDPEAVELYVQEYSAEGARRDRTDGRTRNRLERKIAECTRRIDRMINAIADGGGTFADFRDRLNDARSLGEFFELELAVMESEKVMALHPKIAADYRREVKTLNRALGDNQTPEVREDAIPRLCEIIVPVVLTPPNKGEGSRSR